MGRVEGRGIAETTTYNLRLRIGIGGGKCRRDQNMIELDMMLDRHALRSLAVAVIQRPALDFRQAGGDIDGEILEERIDPGGQCRARSHRPRPIVKR